MKKRRKRLKSLKESQEKIRISVHFYSLRLHRFSQVILTFVFKLISTNFNTMKLFYTSLFFTLSITFFSCQSSYTPMKMNKELPKLTKSKFVLQSEIDSLISSNKCKYLTKGRSYAAPIGLFPKNDLKNAAKGIDEWVQLDKGNTYVLTNYKWITVDNSGSTQLYVDFDTLYCTD